MKQKTLFYFNIFQTGHINYTLPVLKAVVDTGHVVYAFHYPEYREKIESTGAVFRSMPSDERLKEALKHENKTDPRPLICALFEESLLFLDSYFSNPKSIRPDGIIIESFSLSGGFLAEALGVPLIINYFMLVDDVHAQLIKEDNQKYVKSNCDQKEIQDCETKITEISNTLYNKYGIPMIQYGEPNTLFVDNLDKFRIQSINLVSVPKVFLPQVKHNTDNTYFIGANKTLLQEPMLRKYSWSDALSDKYVIYASLGSRYENTTFFENFIDAVSDLNTSLETLTVISLSNLHEEFREKLQSKVCGSDNIVIEDYVPQEELLEYTDLFFTHGGMNSLREAVLRRVKCVFVPQGVDQFLVAKRMHEMKVGVYINQLCPSKQFILNTLNEMLSNSEIYQRNTELLAAEFEEAGGADKAAQIVEEFLAQTEHFSEADEPQMLKLESRNGGQAVSKFNNAIVHSERCQTGLFVIPAYASDKDVLAVEHLRASVDSILAQTDTDWHIAIIDDASTNLDFRAYLAQLSSDYSELITVIWNKENVGPGGCRNQAIKLADECNYPFLLFNDADDLSHPLRLSSVRETFSIDPEISVIYSPFNVIDELGRIVERASIPASIATIIDSYSDTPPTGYDAWIDILTKKGGYVNLTSATSVRTELAIRCPFPDKRISEDAVTWLKYSVVGGKFSFNHSTPSSYRILLNDKTLATQSREGGKERFFQEVIETNLQGIDECIDIALESNQISLEDRPNILVPSYINMATMLAREGLHELSESLVIRAKRISSAVTENYLRERNVKEIQV